MRRFWTLICVVLALVAVGFSVRADRKSRALATELTAADARIVKLEDRVREADVLILGARVYADDVVMRALATAAREGVPMWVAQGPRTMEADLATAPD